MSEKNEEAKTMVSSQGPIDDEDDDAYIYELDWIKIIKIQQ